MFTSFVVIIISQYTLPETERKKVIKRERVLLDVFHFHISFSYLPIANIHEPGHEKMCLMSYATNKGVDQPAHPRSLISVFVFRCLDSKISLDSIGEISRLCGCTGRFVSGLAGDSRRHIFS